MSSQCMGVPTFCAGAQSTSRMRRKQEAHDADPKAPIWASGDTEDDLHGRGEEKRHCRDLKESFPPSSGRDGPFNGGGGGGWRKGRLSSESLRMCKSVIVSHVFWGGFFMAQNQTGEPRSNVNEVSKIINDVQYMSNQS